MAISILVKFLYESEVTEQFCHFAAKLLSCSNYIAMYGGISYFAFKFCEVLAAL